MMIDIPSFSEGIDKWVCDRFQPHIHVHKMSAAITTLTDTTKYNPTSQPLSSHDQRQLNSKAMVFKETLQLPNIFFINLFQS